MRNHILPMYHRLQQESEVYRKYPNFRKDDGKVHLLYLHCLINAKGLYRFILPSRELNRSDSHAAIIANLHKWDFTKSFSDYENEISKELINWADYIILPTVDLNLSEVKKSFKKINPNLIWVMEIDDLPRTKKQLSLLKENLQEVQLISTSTSTTADYIESKVMDGNMHNTPEIAVIPNLISQDCFMKLPAREVLDDKKLRLGIIGTPTIAKQLSSIKDSIYTALKGREEKVQLVLLGWNGKVAKETFFKDLPLECHKAVSIIDYYDKVHALKLDMVILPPLDSNQLGKSSIKYIELSALGIPVLTDSKSIYNRLIVDGETGFMASSPKEWEQKLLGFIEGQLNHREVGQYAQKFSWRNFSWNRSKADQLAATYPTLKQV